MKTNSSNDIADKENRSIILSTQFKHDDQLDKEKDYTQLWRSRVMNQKFVVSIYLG